MYALTPLVRSARVFDTIGMPVIDQDGTRWMPISGGKPVRCQWCHSLHSTGWISSRFAHFARVCYWHIRVNWIAPRIPLAEGYRGVGDMRHQRPPRRRRSS